MAVRSVIDPYVGCIEFVVGADAQEIVGDAGIEGHRGRRIQCRRRNGRDRSQIEIEVFDLGGPIAGHAAFDAAADRPAPCVLWLLTMVLTGLPLPSNPKTVPAVITSTTARPPITYAMASGVTVTPSRARYVAKHSSFWPSSY